MSSVNILFGASQALMSQGGSGSSSQHLHFGSSSQHHQVTISGLGESMQQIFLTSLFGGQGSFLVLTHIESPHSQHRHSYVSQNSFSDIPSPIRR